MKKRLMLPVMAFVFAIGLSFATERTAVDTQWDYIDMGTHAQKIQEVTCVIGAEDCEGQLDINSQIYQIYDGPGLTNPKQGTRVDENFLIPVID